MEITYYLHVAKSSDTFPVFILPDLSATFDIVATSYFLKHSSSLPGHHIPYTNTLMLLLFNLIQKLLLFLQNPKFLNSTRLGLFVF